MKTIIIDSKSKKDFCKKYIDDMPLDGKNTVVFKKSSTGCTDDQRRLNWMWCHEVAGSGIGEDETALDVHIRCKYKFGLPILMEEDEIFPIIFVKFQEAVQYAPNRSALYKIFCSEYIRTENFTKHQRARYLKNFQRFWISQGVNLQIQVCKD